MASRIRWTRFNRELAEAHGFSWGCFSYGPIFSLYDDTSGDWRRELLRALIPDAR
jgi:endoglucanase